VKKSYFELGNMSETLLISASSLTIDTVTYTSRDAIAGRAMGRDPSRTTTWCRQTRSIGGSTDQGTPATVNDP
jgi:hypothetical protein